MACEWIDVDERLPDDDTTVLVSFGEEDVTEPVWLAYFSGENEAWHYVDGGHCYPTHWMELPAPPASKRPTGAASGLGCGSTH